MVTKTGPFWAARFDPDLIVEEQIEGQSWRLLFIDGRFLDAVRRDPPRITGDGRHSIAALVAAENAARLTGRAAVDLSNAGINQLINIREFRKGLRGEDEDKNDEAKKS